MKTQLGPVERRGGGAGGGALSARLARTAYLADSSLSSWLAITDLAAASSSLVMLRRLSAYLRMSSVALVKSLALPLAGACWRAFHGFGQCDRILQGFERGAVRHVIHGEFRCFFSFLLRFFKALLMRGERLRIQRAGVAGGLCHFALVGDCDDGDGCERDGSYCDHGDDGDGLALFSHCFSAWLAAWWFLSSRVALISDKTLQYTKNTSEKRFTAGNNADYFAVKGICL